MSVRRLRRSAQRGMTIIEISITIAILAVLIGVALPNFSAWINNSKIRTAADSILNGIQLARVEAVRRNVSVTFVLTAGSSWAVSTVATAEVIQTRSAAEGSDNTTVTVTPVGATTLTFSGYGRVVGNGDASASITQVEVDSSVLAAAVSRELRVTIGSGGNVRLCDPSFANPDPRAC